MNRPLLALAGLILAGGTTGGLLLIASSGGEEELVQQPATATPVSPSPTATARAAPTTPAASPTASPIASPTPDDIPADWQTYNDSVLGFSLRYPPDLVPKDRTQPSPPDGLNERALEFRSSREPPARGLSIAISSNSKGLTPEQWLSDYGVCLPGTIEQGTVAGRGATFCTSQPAEVAEAAVAFEHMGKMFYITAVLPPIEFEQIIASLRV